MSDKALGAVVIGLSTAFYLFFTLWVIVSPFYPTLAAALPPVKYALLTAASCGLLFIGTLVVYTVLSLM